MGGSEILATVVVPTYNSREPLARALLALRGQTLPAEQFEVIVVDDGSTDDTWSDLQQLADDWPTLQIHRQANSGTASTGRNVGIRAARGRYVFFHDADDWMPADALAGLVDVADTQRADVVVGRVRNVDGGRPVSPLKPSLDADPIADGIWISLSAQKLFRRSMIERLGLEFCEDMVQGEDQIFTGTALLAASRICTLTDRDYYVRQHLRADAAPEARLSRRPQSLAAKLLTCTRMAAVIEQGVAEEKQPPYFDRVMLRTLAPALADPFMRAQPAEQVAALARLRATVLPHLNQRQLNKATEHRRLRLQVAAVGTAEDLVRLNEWLHQGGRLPAIDGASADGSDDRVDGPPMPLSLQHLLDRPVPFRRYSILADLRHRGAQYVNRLRRLLPLSRAGRS